VDPYGWKGGWTPGITGLTELFSGRGRVFVKYLFEVARKGVGRAGPAMPGAPV
jgi:hypothetical protein